MKAKRRLIKKGEALAIMAEALHSNAELDGRGPSAIWWDYFQRIPDNERCGSVAVVHIRGSLDHHNEYGCESYEGILDRVGKAFSGADVCEQLQRRAYWDESIEVPDPSPPSAVVLRLDSPGGVVSGLNQTVFALRRMSRESGIPLIAYVDELAASAAYAIACACDEIYLPASAITGSVGVISTMYEQTEADKAMGVKFVTLTSGARKADGHPHVPISDAAIAQEQKRVDKLARQFYRLVADVRPLSMKEIEAKQAAIFLGKEAVDAGLADGVLSWKGLMSLLDETASNAGGKKKLAQSGTTESPSTGTTGANTESRMSLVALKALVKKTKASLAAEKDPKKRKALTGALGTYEAALAEYKKVKHTVEKHEEESSDEAEDEEEDEAEESEESEESEAKGNETDRKTESDSDDDGDDDDDEEDDDEAEASISTSSLQALAESATGRKGKRAVGALAALIEQGKRASDRIALIERERREEKKSAAIASALNARRITKHEAKTLAGKHLSFVTDFLSMRTKAIVNVDDDSLVIPAPGAKGGGALPADVEQSINMAVACAPASVDRAALRAQMVEAHQKRMAAGLNGVGKY